MPAAPHRGPRRSAFNRCRPHSGGPAGPRRNPRTRRGGACAWARRWSASLPSRRDVRVPQRAAANMMNARYARRAMNLTSIRAPVPAVCQTAQATGEGTAECRRDSIARPEGRPLNVRRGRRAPSERAPPAWRLPFSIAGEAAAAMTPGRPTRMRTRAGPRRCSTRSAPRRRKLDGAARRDLGQGADLRDLGALNQERARRYGASDGRFRPDSDDQLGVGAYALKRGGGVVGAGRRCGPALLPHAARSRHAVGWKDESCEEGRAQSARAAAVLRRCFLSPPERRTASSSGRRATRGRGSSGRRRSRLQDPTRDAIADGLRQRVVRLSGQSLDLRVLFARDHLHTVEKRLHGLVSGLHGPGLVVVLVLFVDHRIGGALISSVFIRRFATAGHLRGAPLTIRNPEALSDMGDASKSAARLRIVCNSLAFH